MVCVLIVTVVLAEWSCERAPSGSSSIATVPPIQRTQHTQSGDAFLDVTMTIDKSELTVADRVRLTLTCTTRSGVELKLPEFGPSLGDFTIVSAVTNEQAGKSGDRETVTSFVLEPFLAGDKSIPPIPVRVVDAARTLNLQTEPATLKVSPVAGADASEKTPLEPAKGPVAILTPPRANRTLVWTISGCSALAIVTAFASIAISNSRRARREADPAFRVRRQLEQVRTLLGQAATHAEASAAAEKLFLAFAAFLRDAWSIPADTQPQARIAPLIASLDAMAFEQRTELSQLLADMERTRFAPGAASVLIVLSLLDRAVAVVDHTIPPASTEVRR